MYICIYIYVYMYTYMYMYLHMCMHMCIYIYILYSIQYIHDLECLSNVFQDVVPDANEILQKDHPKWMLTSCCFYQLNLLYEFNIAIENSPFIVDFMVILWWFNGI